MIEIPDVIRDLKSLEEYSRECLRVASQYDNQEDVAIYQKDAEALRTAISVLEELERNMAKAVKVLRAFRICRACPEDCDSCPYQDGSISVCVKRMDDDIEELLVAAYAEGGDSDEQS